MSRVHHIGCLHIGHENMAIKRGFDNAEEYFKLLKDRWNSTVTKRDKVFIHGDVTMESSKYYKLLDELAGTKTVILGNHDLPQHTKYLFDYVEQVTGFMQYKGFWLSHCPIHPQELLRSRGNIHAHIHENLIETTKISLPSNLEIESGHGVGYFNVDAQALNYKPILFDDIFEQYEQFKLQIKNYNF